MTDADGVDVVQLTREYERLRSQVNAGLPKHPLATPPARGIGLALLLRDGLPAWIEAVRQVLSQAASSAGAARSPSSRAPLATPHSGAVVDGSDVSIASGLLAEPARQRDLTALLASLVLSARRGTDAASMKEPRPCH